MYIFNTAGVLNIFRFKFHFRILFLFDFHMHTAPCTFKPNKVQQSFSPPKFKFIKGYIIGPLLSFLEYYKVVVPAVYKALHNKQIKKENYGY